MYGSDDSHGVLVNSIEGKCCSDDSHDVLVNSNQGGQLEVYFIVITVLPSRLCTFLEEENICNMLSTLRGIPCRYTFLRVEQALNDTEVIELAKLKTYENGFRVDPDKFKATVRYTKNIQSYGTLRTKS